MRLKKKKILVSILIVILLLSTIFSVRSIGATLGETLTDILGTFVGILTWPVRIIALGIAYLMDRITSSIAYLDGGTSTPGKFFTPFEILFNKIRITDIDFFNFQGLSEDCATYKIREAIAQWYYFTRMIAIAASLVVLAYVGVRMSLSTMAQDKAKYKKMLVDWASSVALIFLLHYIIIFVLAVNTALVNAIGGTAGAKGDEISDQIGGIANAALGISVYAIGATIVFTLLVKQTLGLLLAYINRMIKLAFLLIIAPLITITYSIDKMGDNKAQALNAWLKEFVYTILLQPFHCIIYMSLIDIAYSLLAESSVEDEGSLAACILAYLFIKFLTEAEKLVRKIFGFKDTDTGTTLGSGMAAAGATLALSKNIGSTVGKGVRFAKGALPGAMAAAGKAADKASNALGAAATNVRAASRAIGKKDLVDKDFGTNTGEKASGNVFSRMKQQKEALNAARQAYKNADATGKERIKYTRKAAKEDEKGDKAANAGKVYTAREMAERRRTRAADRRSEEFQKKAQESAEKTVKQKQEKKENSRVRKSFRKARGVVRKVNGVASKIVNNELTRTALKGGVATFVGSWSSDKSMAAAITAGVAGWKVTDEALKYTGGQVKSDLNEKFAAAGITSAEKARELYDDNDEHSYAERVKDGKADLREQGKADRDANENSLSESEVNRVLGEMSRQLATNASASLQSILDKALGDSQNKMSQAFEQKLKELYNNQKNANAVSSMSNAFQLGFSERMVFGTADMGSTEVSSAFTPKDPDAVDDKYKFASGAEPDSADTGGPDIPSPEDNSRMQEEIDNRVNQMMEEINNGSTEVTEVVNRTVTEITHSFDTSKPEKTIQELEGIISKLEGMEGDKAKELLAQVKVAKTNIEAEMNKETGGNT